MFGLFCQLEIGHTFAVLLTLYSDCILCRLIHAHIPPPQQSEAYLILAVQVGTDLLELLGIGLFKTFIYWVFTILFSSSASNPAFCEYGHRSELLRYLQSFGDSLICFIVYVFCMF